MLKAPAPDAPHERTPKLPTRPPKPPRRSILRPRFLGLVALLLALNWILINQLDPGPDSVKVPYSPLFLDQVREGNVERINTTGAAITGEFRQPVTWPRSGEAKVTATRFQTQLPTFTDGRRLEQLLMRKGVQIEAEAIEIGRGPVATIL